TLERAPEERVLIQQLAGSRGLDVPAAELDAVAFEQPELFLRDDERRVLGVAFEAQESLQARLQVVATPDAANTGDADVHVLQAELIGHALRAVRRVLEGVG